jgi:2-dehydro-3-deoxyphosphogluconate aldolase / (4S)-4-hydroxy-2-oxoglutarate aldolase
LRLGPRRWGAWPWGISAYGRRPDAIGWRWLSVVLVPDTPLLPARLLIVVRDRPTALELAPLLMGTELALEITSSIEGYVELIGELAGTYESLHVIAGTITDADAARAVEAAGAEALVSPHVVEEIPAAVEIPTIIGALTPTEVTAAAACDATAVKVFPVSAMGGASYLRSLRGPYPDVALVPSGGIRPDDVADYFAAGAVAVALGSAALTSGGDPAAVVEKLSGVLADV